MPKKENLASKPNRASNAEINQALIDNFITLQKVLTNLTLKFEELSNNIEKLLNVFEITAKNFAEKTKDINLNQRESDKDLIEKLNSLLDQNKTISKGILMMEEKVRSRMSPQPFQVEPRFPSKPRPLPRN